MAFNQLPDFFQLAQDLGKLVTIYITLATKPVNDPFEKTRDTNALNPQPVDVYVIDEGFSSLKYKYFGDLPYGSKKILCELDAVPLFINASKIQIGNDFFAIYQDMDKNFAILQRADYAVIVLSSKVDG